MRSLALALLISIPLVALPADHPPSNYAYGVVARLSAFGSSTSLRIPGCPKGTLCPLPAPKGFRYAGLHTHANSFIENVLVPDGTAEVGDIVKFQPAFRFDDGTFVDARIVAIAARKGYYTAECGWTGGDEKANQGAVACEGWTPAALPFQ